LRGWNEQSVYTTSFLVATTELKMNLDELSSLFLFTDNGWINASNVAIEQFAWQLVSMPESILQQKLVFLV
jgi:hypothetical protein